SAPAFTDDSVSNVYHDSYAVYTLDYAAASPGQSLVVQYRAATLFDGELGNVTLQAATLSEAPPPTLAIVNPAWSADSFICSFPTEIGKSYSAQSAVSPVAPADWQTFTNVQGTGSMATVTDTKLSTSGRFYRVRRN